MAAAIIKKKEKNNRSCVPSMIPGRRSIARREKDPAMNGRKLLFTFPLVNTCRSLLEQFTAENAAILISKASMKWRVLVFRVFPVTIRRAPG
ncbi:hypothetical protein [Niabella drilacis]|uniref:hypothetical protein n=1 Tax=Niabella drilacis (strain DSM 25811 / CCM 8410 / CCUG 62505 / LMG 26954 / E90) TaxID=1285928 RepID=UPI0015A0FF50|nr:hypothetical protein [Niabella drilacis]